MLKERQRKQRRGKDEEEEEEEAGEEGGEWEETGNSGWECVAEAAAAMATVQVLKQVN